jgi:hypothetical protein
MTHCPLDEQDGAAHHPPDRRDEAWLCGLLPRQAVKPALIRGKNIHLLIHNTRLGLIHTTRLDLIHKDE